MWMAGGIDWKPELPVLSVIIGCGAGTVNLVCYYVWEIGNTGGKRGYESAEREK